MKKIISLLLIGGLLSGCSYLRVHKQDIEQGNVVTQEMVSHLHKGMSRSQVEDLLGTPLLVNIFTPGRVNYVYTFQMGYGDRETKRVTCFFHNGRLQDVRQS